MPATRVRGSIKAHIRNLYARLATHGTANISHAPVVSGEELARTLGYNTSILSVSRKAWRLFAGCGNPLEEIELKPQWSILDLGCGAGIDSYIASLSLRPPGRVIGVDITEELLYQAKKYADVHSVCHWVLGDGETLPLRPATIDLIIANGSFNLMPNKEQAMAEIWRVLKPGGYLALADLVVVGQMDPIDEGVEEAWSWCIAGALSAGEYEELLTSTGFSWWKLKEKGNYGPLASAHLLARKRSAV